MPLNEDFKQKLRGYGLADATRPSLYLTSFPSEQELTAPFPTAEKAEALSCYNEGWREGGTEVPLAD